jgi:hypothetical protein
MIRHMARARTDVQLGSRAVAPRGTSVSNERLCAKLIALNVGPEFRFNEAISFQVNCQSREGSMSSRPSSPTAERRVCRMLRQPFYTGLNGVGARNSLAFGDDRMRVHGDDRAKPRFASGRRCDGVGSRYSATQDHVASSREETVEVVGTSMAGAEVSVIGRDLPAIEETRQWCGPLARLLLCRGEAAAPLGSSRHSSG